MPQNKQSQIKLLIAKGKEQGYLTYAEVNDHLPEGIVDSDQIEDIINKEIETNDELTLEIDKKLEDTDPVVRGVLAILSSRLRDVQRRR